MLRFNCSERHFIWFIVLLFLAVGCTEEEVTKEVDEKPEVIFEANLLSATGYFDAPIEIEIIKSEGVEISMIYVDDNKKNADGYHEISSYKIEDGKITFHMPDIQQLRTLEEI